MRTQVHTLPAENGATAFLEAQKGIVEQPVQPSLFERSAPDPHESPYFGWSLDDPRDQHPEETAARVYTARYGRPPEHIIETVGNNLLLGPISEVTL